MEPLNAEVDEWEVAVNRVLLQDVIGRGAFGAVWRALLSSPNGQPGNRTVAAKCFTRKPPSICSIDTYVDLIVFFFFVANRLFPFESMYPSTVH